MQVGEIEKKGTGESRAKGCLWIEEKNEAHRQTAVYQGTRENLALGCSVCGASDCWTSVFGNLVVSLGRRRWPNGAIDLDN